MVSISAFALQFTNVDFDQVFASSVDLFITEGAPLPANGSVPQLTDSEVAVLQAQGRVVAGYVNISVTDDVRSYWDTAWTSDGTDTGTPTDDAPAWLSADRTNGFGFVADVRDADWREIVLDQAKDLVNRGYGAIFLDDVGTYFPAGEVFEAAGDITLREYANEMANFVAEIAAELRAINPDVVIITNTNPYIVVDVTQDAAGTAAANAFVAAVDGHVLENIGSEAIEFADENLVGEQLLILESDGSLSLPADQLRGFGVLHTNSINYDTFGDSSYGATEGDDVLTGGDGPNIINGLGGDDIIDGGEGDNSLNGGDGEDRISAGDGDNIITGGAGLNRINVGDGDNVIIGGADLDRIEVGNGNNRIEGGDGNDFIVLGNGNNVITPGAGENIVASRTGATGSNTLFAGVGLDNFTGGTGDDAVFFAANDDLEPGETYFGGDGEDRLVFLDTVTTVDLREVATEFDVFDLQNGGQDVFIDIQFGRVEKFLNISGADFFYTRTGRITIEESALTEAGGTLRLHLNEGGNEVRYQATNGLDPNTDVDIEIIGGDGDDVINGGGDNFRVFGNGGDDSYFGDIAGGEFHGGEGNDILRINNPDALTHFFPGMGQDFFLTGGGPAIIYFLNEGELSTGDRFEFSFALNAFTPLNAISFSSDIREADISNSVVGRLSRLITPEEASLDITITGRQFELLSDIALAAGSKIILTSAITLGLNSVWSQSTEFVTLQLSDEGTTLNFRDVLHQFFEVYGGAGDDVITRRTAGVVSGGGGADTLIGSLFHDTISGGEDGDRLIGDLGDDIIDGGSNIDTAVFAGDFADYTVTQTSTGVFEVAGPDGTDTLTTIEFAQFDDQTIRLLPGVGVRVDFETTDPALYQPAVNALKDFDGNALGGNGAWLRIGSADVNGDGDIDQILVNDAIGRFATVGTAEDGLVYFDDYGWAGETRVAGIYLDPLVQSGDVEQGSPFDSQQRFQNDLQIENINRVLGADDYDGDGLQEVYFALTDGTAYLRAIMEFDGNIRYANYQSEQEVRDYLNANGFGEETYGDWFAPPAAGSSGQSSISMADAPVAMAMPHDMRLQIELSPEVFA